jgi:glycosyltransferase involved in cell wall biosynthesis
VVVHQLLSGAGPVDAVTGQALAYRELFGGWGWKGRDVAAYVDPRIARRIDDLDDLRVDPDDVLLFHYSAYAPRLRELLDLPNRKLLVSHNVTPPRWLWGFEPTIAVQCAVGRAQLPEFAQAVDVAAGVSSYNAEELREAGARRTAVIPILFDPARLGPPHDGDAPSGPPTLLFVGRLAPHKRQDELIRLIAALRRRHWPDARLVLVGGALTPRYLDALDALVHELAPGGVTIEQDLDDSALAERYRSAHVFVCLSEHEGFCIPLLEAFHFGVPVVARPVGGIPEVVGDAALLVDDEDLAVVAELVKLAVEDEELRDELRRRGRARLEPYRPEVIARTLRETIEGLG